jgi:hypothetical protein
MFPTPTVYGNNNRAESSPKAGDGLATAVRKLEFYLTPSATDGSKRANFKAESLAKRYDKHPNGNLAEQIAHLEFRSMTAGNGGGLNPEWVEWLMGFPIGWSDLKD